MSLLSFISTASNVITLATIAPMSLLTYKDVRPWAAAIHEAVVSRQMPPWLADPQIGHWSNNPTLSAAQIEIIKNWTTGPKLEGDPKDMPQAPTFSEGWKVGKPDVILAIPEHELAGTGPDEYTYVTVPIQLQGGSLDCGRGTAARQPQNCSSRSRLCFGTVN